MGFRKVGSRVGSFLPITFKCSTGTASLYAHMPRENTPTAQPQHPLGSEEHPFVC